MAAAVKTLTGYGNDLHPRGSIRVVQTISHDAVVVILDSCNAY